jgi:hypothetical protein
MSSAVNGNYLDGGWGIHFNQDYMMSQKQVCANNLKFELSANFNIGWLTFEFSNFVIKN